MSLAVNTILRVGVDRGQSCDMGGIEVSHGCSPRPSSKDTAGGARRRVSVVLREPILTLNR